MISKIFYCLRALLIQKDAKRKEISYDMDYGLRALLIRKDAKHYCRGTAQENSLRALLIQKDAKLLGTFST